MAIDFTPLNELLIPMPKADQPDWVRKGYVGNYVVGSNSTGTLYTCDGTFVYHERDQWLNVPVEYWNGYVRYYPDWSQGGRWVTLIAEVGNSANSHIRDINLMSMGQGDPLFQVDFKVDKTLVNGSGGLDVYGSNQPTGRECILSLGGPLKWAVA